MENTYETTKQDAPLIPGFELPTGPRVTKEEVEAAIDGVYHFKPASFFAKVEHESMTTTDICMIVLKNGWTEDGVNYCISREIYDQNIGQQLAYDKAFEKCYKALAILKVQAYAEFLATLPREALEADNPLPVIDKA